MRSQRRMWFELGKAWDATPKALTGRDVRAARPFSVRLQGYPWIPQNPAGFRLSSLPAPRSDAPQLLVEVQHRPGLGVHLQPLVVDAVPEDADPEEITAFLREVLTMTAAGGGGLVFARGRDGTVLVTDADRRWHEAVLAACRAQGVRLVGAFLATPATVRAFPEPLDAAVAS